MIHWYKKSLVTNQYVVNGKPVPFQPLGNNRGIISLDDANPANKLLIVALNEASDRNRGGIVKVSEAEALDLKKENPLSSLPASKKKSVFGEPLRVMPTEAPRSSRRPDAVAPAVIKPPAQQISPAQQHLLEKAAEKAAAGPRRPATGRASQVKVAESP